MPRPPRIHVDGAIYLVTAKAVAGRRLFRDEQDRQTYVGLLREYQRKYGFRLLAFVLLPDQVSLCLALANGATSSVIVHDLHSRYTKSFMKRYGHTGHLFQSRFKSTLVEAGACLLPISAFLHGQPQRAGLGEARAYRWSSVGDYLGLPGAIGSGLVDVEPARALLARRGISDYDAYVRTLPAESFERMEQELRRSAVGTPEFLARVRARQHAVHAHVSHVTDVAVPRTSEPRPQPTPSGPRWFRTLAACFGGSALGGVLLMIALQAKTLTAVGLAQRAAAQERAAAALAGLVPLAAVEGMPRLATIAQPSTLNGTSWRIQILPKNGGPIQTDEVLFTAGRVESARLAAEGIRGSNYTLTPRPGGVMLWETMQTSPTSEVICWRGEWDGQTMRGILTRQKPGHAAEEYGFLGQAQPRHTQAHEA